MRKAEVFEKLQKKKKDHGVCIVFSNNPESLTHIRQEVKNQIGSYNQNTNTVKAQAVDQSTIQFWSLLAKGHST